MNEAVTLNELIRMAAIIVGLWGFAKVIMEFVKAVTARHDREQRWDDMADKINSSRENIIMKYDAKLAEMEKTINDNHSDTESKLQQIRAEQCELTGAMLAVLEGLMQLNCNGPVTEAHTKLTKYLNDQAHAKR